MFNIDMKYLIKFIRNKQKMKKSIKKFYKEYDTENNYFYMNEHTFNIANRFFNIQQYKNRFDPDIPNGTIIVMNIRDNGWGWVTKKDFTEK